MFESGYLRIFTWRGVPVRLHWTLPLGALLFSGGAFAPAFWLGFVLLVFAHELGHALLVRKLRHRVMAIDITGFGGMCRWTGAATPLERSVIAWGGVLAQVVLLVIALGLVTAIPWLGRGWLAPMVSVFLWTNVYLMALNLLPFPPLDGASAWRLIPLLRRRGAFGELKRALLPLPRRVKAQAPWRRDQQRDAPRSAAPKSGQGMGAQELADMLRDVGNKGGEARKGDKHRWN